MQRIVVEKVLNYAILNKRFQCQDKSDQFLLYTRREGEVRKSRVVKVIYLGFSFLKKQSKLLIAAPTGATMANIRDAIIHRAMSIDECM